MEQDAAFDEFSRRVGRIFVSWAVLEAAVNSLLHAIAEHYSDTSTGFDKPRNLSKKTEFIRQFFKQHPSWEFISETVNSVMDRVDFLADGRNALAHGLIRDMDAAIAGPQVEIILTKRMKGQERLLRYTFTHDQLLSLGQQAFIQAIFVGHLAEIVSNDLGEHDMHNLLSEIVSQIR